MIKHAKPVRRGMYIRHGKRRRNVKLGGVRGEGGGGEGGVGEWGNWVPETNVANGYLYRLVRNMHTNPY